MFYQKGSKSAEIRKKIPTMIRTISQSRDTVHNAPPITLAELLGPKSIIVNNFYSPTMINKVSCFVKTINFDPWV